MASIQNPASQELAAAILADAFDVLRRAGAGGRRERALVRATLDWFACDDLAWPFSFQNVCAALGLDPATVRRGVECERSARWDAA